MSFVTKSSLAPHTTLSSINQKDERERTIYRFKLKTDTEKEMQGTERKTEGGKGERECFGKSTESLKPSHFS